MSRANEIINATNGGLDIIKHYYPQAEECVGTNKAFKIRDERTPSAHIKEYNGVWYVTDFGDEGKGKNGIEVCMKEEGVELYEALQILAERYNISDTLSPSINKPIINKRPAKQDEEEGAFSYVKKERFSEKELKIWGPKVTQDHLDALSWTSLESYTITKKDKSTNQLITYTIESTDNCPIFLRDCKNFFKIYQPLSPEKERRFFYRGNKPQDFINGLDELSKAYRDFNDKERSAFESDPSNEGRTYKERKLDDAVICSGERDAVNCLSMGHHPIWLNSETADLPSEKYNEIMKFVQVLYNIPDIDSTGKKRGNELALKYIDIKTVKLPEGLSKYKDNRGKPMKDLTDFTKLHPNHNDFENLLRDAIPLKFWGTIQDDKKNTRISISTWYFLNFLNVLGYGKIKDSFTNEEKLVHVDGAIVRPVMATDIRRHVLDWLRERHEDVNVINRVLNSNNTKESAMGDLPILPIQFFNAQPECQYFFFKNGCLKVTADDVQLLNFNECGMFIREEDIIPHNFVRTKPSFKCQRTEDGKWTIKFQHKKSNYGKFIINSSRTKWREELEIKKEQGEQANCQYQKEHQFDIFGGGRLSQEEKDEQLGNLISKLFSIGYILHRYKDASRPFALWILEDKISSDGVASGGSGKSFLMKHLKDTLCNITTINGKERKLSDNQFLYEGVTSSTDIILIDDTMRNLDLDLFYEVITGPLNVNKKHKGAISIDFAKSPKFVFTSNFVPDSYDHGSTTRRVKLVIMSDWYHQQTKSNDYSESRRISDDFGMELGGPDYTEEMWNDDFNFMVDCLRFYLQAKKKVDFIDPPMNKIDNRFARQSMGDAFSEWAEVYFSEEGENVNKLLKKSDVFIDFISKTNSHMKMPAFTKAIKTFVENCNWIDELNPEPFRRKDGRYSMNINGRTEEMIYVKTRNCEVKPSNI